MVLASTRFAFVALTLLLAALLGAGCSCDTVPPVPTDVGPRDTPPRDTPGLDSPLEDVPGLDVPLADGEVPSDVPRTDARFDPTMCSVAPTDVYDLGSDLRMRDRVVGLAGGPGGWGLAYYQAVGGFDQIHAALIDDTGITLNQQITTFTALERDPAIVHTDGGWLLAWVGNHELNFEIYAQGLGPDLAPMGGPLRLTTNANADQTPTLVALPTSGYLVSWVELPMLTDTLAMTRVLDGAGVAMGAARTATMMGARVERPTLAMRSAGAVLVWGDAAGVPPAVRTLPLDAVGASAGTAMTASTEGNATGSVDVTMDFFGGAVVFGVLIGGVRSEVRFRALDETGMPTDSERVVSSGLGADASIAAFSGGYVVSYRAGDAGNPIRLAFLDALGGMLGEIDVTDAEASGGRTTVRISDEGEILIAWADTSPGLTRIRAARVRCE